MCSFIRQRRWVCWIWRQWSHRNQWNLRFLKCSKNKKAGHVHKNLQILKCCYTQPANIYKTRPSNLWNQNSKLHMFIFLVLKIIGSNITVLRKYSTRYTHNTYLCFDKTYITKITYFSQIGLHHYKPLNKSENVHRTKAFPARLHNHSNHHEGNYGTHHNTGNVSIVVVTFLSR
jgi:hypothetical protein